MALLYEEETTDASSSLVAYQGILYVFFDEFSRNFNSILYVMFVFPSRSYGGICIFYCCNNYNNPLGCHYPPTRKTERIGLVYFKDVVGFSVALAFSEIYPCIFLSRFPFTENVG